MKTKEYELIELELCQTIRKNLTIRDLSIILSETISELINKRELLFYTGDFEHIQTLLDCILDESNDNNESLAKFQEYLDELSSDNDKLVDVWGQIEISDLIKMEEILSLPKMSLYNAIKKVKEE